MKYLILFLFALSAGAQQPYGRAVIPAGATNCFVTNTVFAPDEPISMRYHLPVDAPMHAVLSHGVCEFHIEKAQTNDSPFVWFLTPPKDALPIELKTPEWHQLKHGYVNFPAGETTVILTNAAFATNANVVVFVNRKHGRWTGNITATPGDGTCLFRTDTPATNVFNVVGWAIKP